MRERPRIQDLSTHDLLADRSGPLADRAVLPARSVESWIKAEGYYPGTTREPATKLHAAYAEWCTQHVDILGHKPMAIEKWGAEMRKYFQAGRSNAGIIYYISRTSTDEIIKNMTPPTPPKTRKR